VTRALRLLVAGLACLALAAPQAALAQDRKPSASELRETYPLHTGAQAERTPDRTASPTTAPAEPAATTSDRTVIQYALLGLLAALAFTAGFALSLRPMRRRRAVASQPPPAPARRVDPPLLSPARAERAPAGLPPSTRRPWTAEISWRTIEGAPRFCAVARNERGAGEVVLMMSTPLAWPPAGPEDVQALRDSAGALETSLLDAGWTALPPGDAWYEKRFAWRPVEPAPGSDRFSRTPAGVSSS
jgi:hypothetical protein